MDITPKLQLNLHPKDCQNLSFVSALNVRVSNDESCVINEESIKENTIIRNYLTSYYYNTDDGKYTIIGIIPCNTELVILAVGSKHTSKGQIFRYKEGNKYNEGTIKCVYGNNNDCFIEYHNGKIKGTFTYNVENSLIIAIAEYDGDVDRIPLRTINLGNFDNDDVYNDLNLKNSQLNIAPEVYIPSLSSVKYISGSAYKGWYYLFIRYKINSVDYTQWFNFGYPIYVDTLKHHQIIRYCYGIENNRLQNASDAPNIPGLDIPESQKILDIVAPDNNDDGFCVGCSDYFSDTTDIANESFIANFTFSNEINFDTYQIGILCCSKNYTKAFRTADIFKENNNTISYILNNDALIESSVDELINDNYNYYDVKNIINYNNRLYIANYKEDNINDKNIQEYLDNNYNNIKYNLTVSKQAYIGEDLVQDEPLINKGNHSGQYEVPIREAFKLSYYLNIDDNIEITVQSSDRTIADIAANFIFVGVDASISGSSISYTIPNYAIIAHIENNTIYKFENETVNVYSTAETLDINRLIRYNYKENALNGSTLFINPSITFDNRRNKSTLIPGETYNFFIHFVDKYGHATNGFQLKNNIKYYINNPDIEDYFPLVIKNENTIYYVAVPINNNIIYKGPYDTNYVVNTTGMKYFTSIKKVGNNYQFINEHSTPSLIENAIKEQYKYFTNTKYSNYKWYQIAVPFGDLGFVPFYNDNGDRLFRVPYVNSNYDNHYRPCFTKYGLSISSSVVIPDDYIGYYISYEKFEPMQRVTGVLTRNDFRCQDYVKPNGEDIILKDTANCHKSNTMMFYSDMFDIADNIKSDYDIIRIEKHNVFKSSLVDNFEIPMRDYYQRGCAYNYCHDFNRPEVNIDNDFVSEIYPMPDYKIVVGDSAADARQGLGTGIRMTDSYNLFSDYTPQYYIYDRINIYKATLVNVNTNIYCNNNKILIRLSNIIYGNTIGTNINNGYNGHLTINSFIVYENPGISFNDGDNTVRKISGDKYILDGVLPEDEDLIHSYNSIIPFAGYVQLYSYDDYFHESKSFKNNPQGIIYFVKHDDEDANNNRFAAGCIVIPANSIDLFENRQGSSDEFNNKTYTNFKKDIVSVDVFNKTIRRSNVIQDESRVNGWRNFSVENYKNITENKGSITNLVGIGTYLIVHTEHSMFMFSTDNILKADNQDIQLSQPDAFEVNYKEVFTSDLGYGGLQDDKSFIVDQFGYIYYNNDFNKFYRFDNGTLNIIDDDITSWLDLYKPYNVRFANDKRANRLLIKMNYNVGEEVKNVVISYNYNTNNFVSLHSYYFDEAFNTKNRLYLKCDNIHINCSLHQFVTDSTSYCYFDNVIENINIPTIYPSKISIIVNEVYKEIKFLDYITYKLNKVVNPAKIDYIGLPVEGHVEPYAGNYLTVYNNEVNTGKLDISITENTKNIYNNYRKPYWELGNWNFSYLRNNINNYKNYGDAFNMSRIYGNYFIAEYEFTNDDSKRIEFEDFGYSIIK